MSGNMNEYVFCPYCGGITPPGTCVNCGMSTAGEKEPESQPAANTSAPVTLEKKENNDSMSRFQPGGSSQYSSGMTAQPGGTNQNITGGNTNVSGGGNPNPYGGNTNTYGGGNPNPYGGNTNTYGGGNPNPYGGNTNTYGGGNPNPYGGSTNTYGGGNPNPYGRNANAYGGTNPSYQQPQPKKKSRAWLWVILIVAGGLLLLLLLLAIIAVVAAIFAPQFMAGSTSSYPSTSVVTQPSSDDYDYDYYDDDEDYSYEEDSTYSNDEGEISMRPFGRHDLSNFDWDEYADDADVYSDTSDGDKDIFLAGDYSSTFGSNHHNYSPDDFSGEYYEPFVDCIDSTLDYGLSRHYIEYSDTVNNINVEAYIAYIQLEGNVVPNQDELNREILELTANEFWGCLDMQNTYGYYYGDAIFIVDSFVTYNDSEKMSILLDINVMEGGYFTDSYIYAINVDLVNGEIMDNGSILNIDEDFAAMFRERCETQNGTDNVGLENLTDQQVAEYLVNERSCIIFYTPMGIELGYCYEVVNTSRGWMTITLSDYEEYLK